MKWNELSMKDRSKYIQLAVSSGVTDLNNIRDTYNSFAEGGDTQTSNNTEPGFFQKLASNVEDGIDKIKNTTRDLAYSIMVGQKGSTKGIADRTIDNIINSASNINEIVANRGDIPRNLSSLYIYGNDLDQFKESSTLKNLGVNYDKYLRSIGRDPNKVKTYIGYLPAEVMLPDLIEGDLPEYIKSSKNKTYGNNMDEISTDTDDSPIEPDDVAGFLQRLDLDSNGNPIVVNSDLWDFEPSSYFKNYGYNPSLYLKAKVLDKVGTPFILKDTYPVNFVDIDTFYDNYTGDLENTVVKDFGFLPEITVVGRNEKNKKNEKNEKNRKNRLKGSRSK